MKLMTAATVAVCLTVVPLLGFAAPQPDAILDFTGHAVGVGVGVNWAKGTLHYQGKSIPVSVRGLSLASVGVTNVSALGDVYHLTQLSDFAGKYTAVSAGAALAGGGSVAAMQNANGVVIRMRAATQGVELNLGIDGIAIDLAE